MSKQRYCSSSSFCFWEVLFYDVAFCLFVCVEVLFICVCVEVLRPSQPNGVMLSVVSLPNHTFTGQA